MSPPATLHYIYDPFCGWCYAAAPLLTAATQVKGLKVVAHGGGMLTGSNAKKMTPEWREFVRPHEQRIAAISGQSFGAAYRDGTQFDYDVVLDSGPPTAAMLAAEELAGAGLTMLKRLQVAYYVEGRPIGDPHTLATIARELGLDSAAFAKALDRASANLGQHLQDSRELLSRLGAQGFPALAVEQAGRITNLHLGQFLGKPELFRAALQQQLETA
jgi:putative protein-disulfide isomerase